LPDRNGKQQHVMRGVESSLRLDWFGSICSEIHWAYLSHCTYTDL